MSITEQELDALLDGVFKYVEGLTGNPLEVAALEFVRKEVEAAGIPALLAWLKSQGFVLP